MKALSSILLLFISLTVFSQEKLVNIDPLKNYYSALDYYNQGNNTDAIKLIDQINENDSIYFEAIALRINIALSDTTTTDYAIILSDSIIKRTNNPYSFYLTKGVGLMQKKEYNQAIKTFHGALPKYPMSYLIHFNLGLAYEYNKQYREAIEYYQKSILLNPYYSSPHIRLAILCYNENLTTQAVLCYNTYLLLNPSNKSSFDILVALNDVVSKKNDGETKNIQISDDDKAFEELDLIVNNYAALNKNYTTDNKLNLPVVKQNHAIMHQLKNFEGNGGFWTEKYIPFYLKLTETGNFNNFIYRIFSSSEDPKHQKILKKNEDKQSEFIDWAASSLTEIMGKNNTKFWGKEVKNFNYSSSGIVNSIGTIDVNGSYTGDFIFFNDNGSLLSRGSFKNNEREGEWNWYFEDGNIKSAAIFSKGIYQGKSYLNFINGIRQIEGFYKNDYYHNKFKRYNILGALLEETEYNEGTFHGKAFLYYPLGKDYKKYSLKYNNGKPDSTVIEYFPEGTIKMKKNIDVNTEEGERIYYYRTGELSYKYGIKNDNYNGNFLSLYVNGKPHTTGQYTNRYKTGTWKSYYTNGNLNNKSNYDDKGRLNGIYKEFDRNNHILCEFSYNKGNLMAYKFFDKTGKLIKEDAKQNKTFNYERFNRNGTIRSRGSYKVTGEMEGEWNFYNGYGVLISKETYKNNEINGSDSTFYVNGKLKEEVYYENGVENGYASEYYINGTLSSQGYFIKGNAERNWFNYYPDGKIKQKIYYKNNNIHGYQYDYSVEGNLSSIDYYQDGIALYTILIDSTERKYDTLDFKELQAKTYYYSNGKTQSTKSYLNGIAHGKFVNYHFNGQKKTEGEFYNDERHGKWQWWNDEGTLITESEYYHGTLHGKDISYHKNGKISSIEYYEYNEPINFDVNFSKSGDTIYKVAYKDNLKNGANYFYSDNGELQLIRYYDYGEIIAYSYPDKDGNPVEMIPIENGTAKVVAYYQNGNKSREFNFLGGKFHGQYTKYYSDGSIKEVSNYEAGESQGENIAYYSNKNIKVQKYYLNDVLHGPYKKYYKNGILAEEKNFVNGGLTGSVRYYDENGKLVKTEFYYNDRIYNIEYQQ